ncbi:Xanthocillin biosynthesis cluster protein D [Erysiphe necator]|nr:Xanthocillin biosynthesis cluster protein D [Erysiphe necator]
MMADTSIFNTRAPYHITALGLLTGTQFFQSFVGGVVAYKALPRSQFSQLQQKIFPVYFSIQTVLPVLIAITYPGPVGKASGIKGVFENRHSVLIPISIILVTSSLNLLLVGPATTKAMRDRKVQETRDGKKYTDPGPHSEEMQRLNSLFSKLHGISSLLNLMGFISTISYSFTLARRIV